LTPRRAALSLVGETKGDAMISRRETLAAGAALSASAAFGQPAGRNAWAFTFPGIDGPDIPLRRFAGTPVLIVNTASRCGFVSQYEGLQQLWTRYRARGLTVVAVPSNDFGGQEPGANAEIQGFCSQTYGVTFPLAGKVEVLGEGAHPFYRWAAAERPQDRPRWNFHKYLIGRDGRIAAVFPTSTPPMDAQVVAAVERALGGGAVAG
jgi:glutathione peroxidase